MMNKKSLNLGIALLLIGVVVLIGVVGVLYFSDRAPKIKQSTSGNVDIIEIEDHVAEYQPEFSIEVDYCSYVDSAFKCLDKGKAVFKKGEDIWLLITIDNLKAVKENAEYFTSYVEEREVYDPTNTLIPAVSGVVLTKKQSAPHEGYFQIYVRNQLTTSESDIDGNYKINIRIIDKNSGSTKEDTSEFSLI